MFIIFYQMVNSGTKHLDQILKAIWKPKEADEDEMLFLRLNLVSVCVMKCLYT